MDQGDANRLKLTGTTEPTPAVRRLKAGALEVDFTDGNLRNVRWRGTEVLRAIAYVVRDRDWGTYAPAIEDLAVEERDEDFILSYRASCRTEAGGTLHFSATVSGHATGRLTFRVEAVPDLDFETNRCGFCMLHPIASLAGRPVAVTHTDGGVEQARFPDLIDPWQPFKEIRAIAHEVAPGVLATCTLEGDTFEMEDQRNWSDASYKTYVRPLALPWPYRLPAHNPNHQSVTLSIEGQGDSETAGTVSSAAPVIVALGGAGERRMPRFGIAIAPDEVSQALSAIDSLRDLAPGHLLLHFDPTVGHGAEALADFAKVAVILPDVPVTLECVVPGVGDPAAELAGIAALLAGSKLCPAAIVVGPSVDRQSTPPGSAWPDCPPLETIYEVARAAFPGVELGGGMFSYFTELNRKRVPAHLLDFATHATCPIVHAGDDASVMQSLEALPFITRTAEHILGETPYHLGPTTIGMRQNPYGSRTMPNPDERRIAMAADDPRQRGLFAAAWTVGYAARLAASAVAAWTGASFAGPRGLLAREGAVVPAFHVAKALSALSGSARRTLTSTGPSRIDGFAALRPDGATEIWLANLTEEVQSLLLEAGDVSEIAVLDLDSFDIAAEGVLPTARPGTAPSQLGPYGVMRLITRPI